MMSPRGGFREGAGRKKSDRPTVAIRLDAEIAEKVKALLEEMSPTEILFRLEINHDKQREAYEELAMENERLKAFLANFTGEVIETVGPEVMDDDASRLSLYQRQILAAIRDRPNLSGARQN